MRHQELLRYLIFTALISCNISLSAQKLNVDNSGFFYQISPIFDFKRSIVSLTFDDGYLNQFEIGMPLLKESNLPATFYLITNDIDSTIRNIILNNQSGEFEIGSHTVSHPDLVKIGNYNAYTELFNSKSILQDYFGTNSGLTLAYPYGDYNNDVKKIAGNIYLAARSTAIGFNSFHNLDRYALKIQGFTSKTGVFNANSWIDFAIKNDVWLVEMIHGINDKGFSPVYASVLKEHLDYIKKFEDEIWCSSVVNVIKYIDESKNAEVNCEFCNDTVFKVRISENLNFSIYDQPLSVKIKVPSTWDSISIPGIEKFKIEYNNKSKFVLFNAPPDNQLITIRPGIIKTPEKESGFRLVYLSANPVLDNIRLTLEALDKQDFDIVLSNINGRLLIHKEEKGVTGVINLLFDTSGISQGIYLLKVISTSNGSYIVKKMIKM